MKRRGEVCKSPAIIKKFKKAPEDPSKKKLTPGEEIKELDEQINQFEEEIRSLNDQFKTTRQQMLMGIPDLESVTKREKLETLTEQLNKLRVKRNDAFDRANIIKEGSSFQQVTTKTIGGCEKGCDQKNLQFCAAGCVDVCNVCGSVYDHRIDNTPEHFSYGDIHTKRRGSGYKPPNHFAEIIAQFQGKRRSSAPQDVVDVVADYCKRYGFQPHQITPQIVRMFLKQKQQEVNLFKKYSKLKKGGSLPASSSAVTRKYTDYYKHCPEIAYRLSGIPPPYMTPSQEDKITAIFPMVVEAYKTSPRYLSRKANRVNRKKAVPNLLNYHYVFFKECQLLGYDEFLPFIALPKSVANILDNDENGWKWVCKVHGFTFIPTC